MKNNKSMTKLKAGVEPKESELNTIANSSNVIILRKELNVFFKATCFGLMAILFYSIGYNKGNKNIAFHQTNNISQEGIKNLEKKLEEIKLNNIKISNEKQRVLASQVERRMKSHLDQRSRMEAKLIDDQKNEILNLKYKIEKLVVAGTFDTGHSDKVIPYSDKNYSVLSYEQRLIRMRFREKQNTKQEAFLLVNDVSTSLGKQNYHAFLDQQKVNLYKLKQKHQEDLRKFRKNKYRSISSVVLR